MGKESIVNPPSCADADEGKKNEVITLLTRGCPEGLPLKYLWKVLSYFIVVLTLGVENHWFIYMLSVYVWYI